MERKGRVTFVSTPVQLSLACGDYDIHDGLISGRVKPQAIDLSVLVYNTPPRQWRMDQYSEFDICEFSMSSYLVTFDRQTRGEPMTMEPVRAIPVFPHRRFRHSFIFVNSAAGIGSPKDLEGKRVGLRTWQATAGLWARGILQDEYGVDLTKVRWYTSDDESIVDAELPAGFDIQRIPEGASVTDMLLSGEVDALIYPEIPAAFAAGDQRIRRLFPNFKEEEMAYFRKTGCFPIMHTVVIKESVLEKHPWVAREMLIAFKESTEYAFRRMQDPRRVSLAWGRELLEEQQQVLGANPWPVGVPANLPALERMIRFSHEQGMISRRYEPEELFVPSTLGEMPAYH
jgi:4,5-dihydroxyphthalate decarboxylase